LYKQIIKLYNILLSYSAAAAYVMCHEFSYLSVWLRQWNSRAGRWM